MEQFSKWKPIQRRDNRSKNEREMVRALLYWVDCSLMFVPVFAGTVRYKLRVGG
jgi:hypothetical protein